MLKVYWNKSRHISMAHSVSHYVASPPVHNLAASTCTCVCHQSQLVYTHAGWSRPVPLLKETVQASRYQSDVLRKIEQLVEYQTGLGTIPPRTIRPFIVKHSV